MMNTIVTKTPRSVQLPKWIDDRIFNQLGAEYCPSCSDMTVIDWNRIEIKKYLGTYFPRSYVESFCVFSDFFNLYVTDYKNREHLSIFDFGCGTGGEILGFLDAVEQKLPNVNLIKIRVLDGNHHALHVLENVISQRNKFGRVSTELKIMPVTIDDFYDMSIVRSVIDDIFDFVITFKAICEFVTKQQFEERNPYANVIQTFSDILATRGKMLIADVSTKNDVSQEWLPKMLDEGIRETGAIVLARNNNFNETFIVKHSRSDRDRSKIAWRFIEPNKGDSV